MGREVATLALLVSVLTFGDEPTGRDINPGVLGANALPPFAADPPWVDDHWSVEASAALQSSTAAGGVDTSVTAPFRLEYPFGGRASLVVLGSPFEWFRYAPESIAAWQPSRTEGVTRADVTIGARFHVLRASGWRPAVGARALVKTATGEDLRNRRFLDAPAYQFDLSVGDTYALPAGRLEVVAALGFLAWQQGAAGQNDALAWAARAAWLFAPLTVRLEARGYRGWQQNDAPVVLAVSAGLRIAAHVELIATVSRTFQHPAAWDGRVGVRFSGAPFAFE